MHTTLTIVIAAAALAAAFSLCDEVRRYLRARPVISIISHRFINSRMDVINSVILIIAVCFGVVSATYFTEKYERLLLLSTVCSLIIYMGLRGVLELFINLIKYYIA